MSTPKEPKPLLRLPPPPRQQVLPFPHLPVPNKPEWPLLPRQDPRLHNLLAASLLTSLLLKQTVFSDPQ